MNFLWFFFKKISAEIVIFSSNIFLCVHQNMFLFFDNFFSIWIVCVFFFCFCFVLSISFWVCNHWPIFAFIFFLYSKYIYKKKLHWGHAIRYSKHLCEEREIYYIFCFVFLKGITFFFSYVYCIFFLGYWLRLNIHTYIHT